MEQRKLKFSANPDFFNKTTPNKTFFQLGFSNLEDTLEELAEVINDGWAISYQYRNQIRSANNFMATDYVAVDIDDGMTTAEALENPIVKQYCSMYYLTPSHTPDHHHFRLIFILPRTITKSSEIKAVARSLANRLGGDMAATDAARISFGHKDSYPKILNRSITDAYLEELIEDGQTVPVTDSKSFSGSTTNRSDHQPEPSFKVTKKDGIEVKLSEIKTTTSIICPYHEDRNPSAFVSISSTGLQFIYCSKCQKSWHVKGTSIYEKHFTDFDQVVRSLKENVIIETTEEHPLKEILEIENISPENIIITNNEYLKLDKLEDGLTLIKSPKGTGKTYYLAQVLGKIINRYNNLDEYEEDTDFETEKKLFSDEKILLIGHRQALIGDLCKRLNLNSYLDDSEYKSGDVKYRKKRYGVCLDSLNKVSDEKYDIIVIDEVEQVLAHFLSDTVGEKRRGLFDIFSRLIRKAKKIVALDADLGWISYTTLSHLTRNFESPTTEKALKGFKTEQNIKIYINDGQPQNRELLIYNSITQLIQEIRKQVIDGKRIFVTSNSKSKIDTLTKSIKSLEKELNETIEIISITSENSRSSSVQRFIKDIKNEILKYQVVLCSPSLGTGIDITFENGKQEIDSVFGMFENQITTHFEIDQQLARVRNPGSVHVWVSPRMFKFETEFQVTAKDFLQRHLLGRAMSGNIPTNWNDPTDEIDPFLKMAAMIVSHQRASKNRLRSNFLQYRMDQGWTITSVKEDELLQKEGGIFYKIGKDISEQEWKTAVLNAQVMDNVVYERFREKLESNDQEDDESERFSYYRTRIELFYRQVVNEQLLEMDRKGSFRRAIWLYELVTGLDDEKYKNSLSGKIDKSQIKNDRLKKKLFKDTNTTVGLLYLLLSTTPIFKNGKFVLDSLITVDDLKKFIEASSKFKILVLSQLEVNTMKNIESNPIQHLNKLLPKVGAKVVEVKQTNHKGVRTYHYSLDSNLVKNVEEIVKVRKDSGKNGWDFVNNQYGFVYNDLEDEWLNCKDERYMMPIDVPGNRKKENLDKNKLN